MEQFRIRVLVLSFGDLRSLNHIINVVEQLEDTAAAGDRLAPVRKITGKR